jgi:tetrahydromethanopterin S-methyltransferase subunit B
MVDAGLKKSIVESIDTIQIGVKTLQGDIDDYLEKLTPEEFALDGTALRQIQGRLARTYTELNTLYRRMDT